MSSPTSTASHTYPIPPPTVNSLDAQERTRLLRSSRKLGVVLGTTPIFIEVPPTTTSPTTVPITPRTKAYRREGRIFGHSPSSSISSESDFEAGFMTTETKGALETVLPPMSITLSIENPAKMKSSKVTSKKPLAQPLLLRLRSVPTPPARPAPRKKVTPILPPTPLSPTFSHNSTSQDGSSLNKERDARRKKMAKLTRTLGENIPPELVFPTASSARPSVDSPFMSPLGPRPKGTPKQRSKSKSKPRALPSPPTSAPIATTKPELQTQIDIPTPSLAERRNQQRPRSLSLGSAKELKSTMAIPTQTEQKETLSLPKKDQKRKPGPLSLEKLYIPPVPQTRAPVSLRDIYNPPKGSVRPPPRSSSIPTPTTRHRHAHSSPSNTVTPTSSSSEPRGRASADSPAFSTMAPPLGEGLSLAKGNQGRRKEREWSGEWNHEMDEVVRRLRNLGR